MPPCRYYSFSLLFELPFFFFSGLTGVSYPCACSSWERVWKRKTKTKQNKKSIGEFQSGKSVPGTMSSDERSLSNGRDES